MLRISSPVTLLRLLEYYRTGLNAEEMTPCAREAVYRRLLI
jgi:hypothetical protein